ncbi:MAG: TSUP family transporter [Candidatus Heimdallarchaeota archaeon]|nr:TSUP family transporter [Candidatus Heimdallarchaeota archaeon]
MNYLLILLFAGLIGLFAGFLSGMLGIGGGSIRIPLLNLLGIPLINAFAINLFTIPISSLLGAKSHIENLEAKTTLLMVTGGCFGTIAGTLIAFRLAVSSLVLAIIFFLASILTIVGLNLYKFAPKFSAKLKPTPSNIVFGAFYLNLITGMKGGSGGSLFPPFLRTLNYKMHKAIAVSLLTTFFTSLTGVIFYYFQEIAFANEGIVVILGSLVGVKIGSMVSLKTKPRALEISLSIIVFILSSIPIIKAILL